MHRTWSIAGRRYVTVMFNSQKDHDRWESLFKMLIQLDASEDVIGTVCAEMYGRSAWLYYPPSGQIELYVSRVITPEELKNDCHIFGWAISNGQQPVRRYDGTAQQAEEAMAAEPVR